MGNWDAMSVGNGGWVRLRFSTNDRLVLVRFEPQADGWLTPAELYVGGGTLSDYQLDGVDLKGAQAMANDPTISGQIRHRLGVPAPQIHTAATYYNTSFGHGRPNVTDGRGKNWVVEMMLSQFVDTAIPRADPNKLRSGWVETTRDARLVIPSGTRYPDTFYQDVAEVYRRMVVIGAHPGKAIAEANKVPATTAARWFRVCRSKGYLPAGTRGRAG